MKKIIGLLVVCAIFGVIFMGCQHATTGTKLEGRWKASDPGIEMISTINGSSITLAQKGQDGWLAQKGTFTLTDTTIEITFTEASEAPVATEAEALGNMVKQSQSQSQSATYTLNTAVQPNTLTLTLSGGSKLVLEKQ